MGLTQSLYTGLSGLSSNSNLISVTGNNIANVNTNGYKASRLSFETQISQLFSSGSAPTATSGGTNPLQIGLGVRLGESTRNFGTGNITPTGVNTDLAIEGNGFFVLNYGNVTRYTRAGNFTLDRDFNLTYSGGKVQGYGVDTDYNVNQQLGDVNIPIGNLTIAQATKNVRMGGNLNAGGDSATQGTVITSDALTILGGGVALGTTALTNLDDGSASPLFATGDIITLTGVTKGGSTLPNHTFEVGATNTTGSDANGTTVDDLMQFIQDVLGVDTTVGSAGVAINGSGQIVVTGNSGSVNDLVMESGNLVKNLGGPATQPITWTKDQAADGESVRTTFLAYDTLGNATTVDLSIVLEAKTNDGTSWRFYEQSEDDTRVTRALGNGTLSFDTNGQLVNVTSSSFSIYHDNTGAVSPQSVNLLFGGAQSNLSALTDITSQVSSLSQDGAPMGTLQDFSVADDGTIVGQFSNSMLRNLGRVVVANFTNPQGLTEAGGNLFSQSVNSGSAQILTPGSGGAGRVVGGAVELSNVELSQEFINLITASTGYSASSRVLTTSDRLIQELLSTIR